METYSISRLIAKLAEQDVHLLAKADRDLYVRYGNIMFCLSCGIVDIDIQKVNFGHRSTVPVTYYDKRLNEETLAYRILAALRGGELDYSLMLEATDDNLACAMCGVQLMDSITSDQSGYGALNFFDDRPYCNKCHAVVVYNAETSYEEALGLTDDLDMFHASHTHHAIGGDDGLHD